MVVLLKYQQKRSYGRPTHTHSVSSAPSPGFFLLSDAAEVNDRLLSGLHGGSGRAESPEPNKDTQNLLKASSSEDFSRDPFQPPAAEEEGALSGHTAASLLHMAERRREYREPLSSVSSLEVHFDLLDLTELTDMSDQELAEVFVDSDEENHNESSAGSHQSVLQKTGYMRSPSWTRCNKADTHRERKHHSDSDTMDPLMKLERSKQP
ncbi:hypothetical protein WMY93_013248 [Mugilogobius chulae]|uniref:Dysbindin domain-containing protein 1 n=1 Tax=Mugilogobius chulae TaxID=88201 RepID=A0AAW0P8L3_9GOBI